MRSYQSIELDDDEKLDGVIPAPEPVTPNYPYGTSICLNAATLAKMKFEDGDLPEKGDMLHFAGFWEVTHVSTSDGPSGKDCRVELQLCSVSVIEDESTEFEDDD